MNLKYINVMVDKIKWRENVAALLDTEPDATARLVEEKKHGYLVRIGAPDIETLDRIAEAATTL